MSLSFEDVANATVQVFAGRNRGSGFAFANERIVVTNHHVIAGAGAINVGSGGVEAPAHVLVASPATENDFAVLELRGDLPGLEPVLQPASSPPTLGDEVVFAGYPHGISDLLVQRAGVCGRYESRGFHLDGSINGGNSGGPVVDLEAGKVVGIVTQRRFINGGDIENLATEAQALGSLARRSAAEGSVIMMGIDIGAMAGLVGSSLDLLAKTLVANANAGIGIAFDINWVTAACASAGLLTL